MLRKWLSKFKWDPLSQPEDKHDKCYISYKTSELYYLSRMEPDYFEGPVTMCSEKENIPCDEAKNFFDAIQDGNARMTVSNLKAIDQDGKTIAHETREMYPSQASLFAREAVAVTKCNKIKSNGRKEMDQNCFAFESNNEVKSHKSAMTECTESHPFVRENSQCFVLRHDGLYRTLCHLTNLNEGYGPPRPPLDLSIDIITKNKPGLFQQCIKKQRVFHSDEISHEDALKVLEETKKRFT